MDRKNNCFNFIRTLAAIQVFIGHASLHLEVNMSALASELWWIFRGVPIFFVLSGFVIWNSLETDCNFNSFCVKRVTRLYPELWGGVLLNAIIVFIAYGSYIKIMPYLVFQFTQATVLQFWTPSFLRGYGSGTPNGSLWTIGVMVQAYIVIFALHAFLHKKKPIRFFLTLAIGILLNIGSPLLKNFLPEIIFKLYQQTFLPYIWLFVIGALVCEYFDTVIGPLKKYWWLLLVFTVIISFSHIEDGFGAYETIKSTTLGLSILGFGYAFPGIRFGYDYSYGFYIYHMVVINLMVEFGYVGEYGFILVAFAISILLAFLSYHLIGGISKTDNKISLNFKV